MNRDLLRNKIRLEASITKLRATYERALFHSLTRLFNEELLGITTLLKVGKNNNEITEFVNKRSSKLRAVLFSHYVIISREINPGLVFEDILDQQVHRIMKTTRHYLQQALESKDPLVGVVKVYKYAGRYLRIARTETQTMLNFSLWSKALKEGKENEDKLRNL